MNYLVMAHWA